MKVLLDNVLFFCFVSDLFFQYAKYLQKLLVEHLLLLGFYLCWVSWDALHFGLVNFHRLTTDHVQNPGPKKASDMLPLPLFKDQILM